MSRKRKVADFPEEFLAAWALAAQGQLTLNFPTDGKAMNYRQQLHAFRKAFVQENGQASCAAWFAYDLVIAREPSGSWQIICGLSDTKKQIRDQIAAAGNPHITMPHAKIKAPAKILPPGLMFGQRPDGSALLNDAVPPVSPEEAAEAQEVLHDAVSKGLEKLGFTSKP